MIAQKATIICLYEVLKKYKEIKIERWVSN